MLGKTSLANLALIIGGILTTVGLTAYFADFATLNLAGFFYGIPLVLGGAALKAGELEPIRFSEPTSEELLALRKQQATFTQNKLRQDVTRYRYGQKLHLDEALKRLGLTPNDKKLPVLFGIKETAVDGFYTLVLEFKSPEISRSVWQEKRDKITAFFGPGVRIEITEPGEERIDLALIAEPKTVDENSSED